MSILLVIFEYLLNIYQKESVLYYLLSLLILLIILTPIFVIKINKYIKIILSSVIIVPYIVLNLVLIELFGYDEKMIKNYERDTINLIEMTNYIKSKNDKYKICLDSKIYVIFKEQTDLSWHKKEYIEASNKFNKLLNEYQNSFKYCDGKQILDYYDAQEIQEYQNLYDKFIKEVYENNNKNFPITSIIVQYF